MTPPPRNEVRFATGDGMGEQWSSVGRLDKTGSFQFPECQPPEGLHFETQIIGLKAGRSTPEAQESASSQCCLTRRSKLRLTFSVDVALDGDVHRCFQLQTRHPGEDVAWVVLGGNGSDSSSGESSGPSSSSGSSSRGRSRGPRHRGFKAAARQKDIKLLQEALRQQRRFESMADELTSRMSKLNIKNDGFDKDEDYHMLSPIWRVKTLDRMDMD